MAITDILSDANNINAIIEVTTLFFIVAGFFRWYDSKYQKGMTGVKEEVIAKVDDLRTSLCEKMNNMERHFDKLEDRFNEHLKERLEQERNETY